MNLACGSSYYRPRGRLRSDKNELIPHIEAICVRWLVCGYRRVTRHLGREGHRANHKGVAHIMRQRELQASVPCRFVANSHGAALAPFPDRSRGLARTGPDRLRVADLTDIRVLPGFVFLAVLPDAWSRRVVGYAIAREMDVCLTLAALQAAIASRSPPPG